jgi:hypothetical protein
MTSFIGQACWPKMMSPGGKLTALVCHLTTKVNQAEELTYLTTNIASLEELLLIFKTLFTFLKTSYLNDEVYRTEPIPSVSVSCPSL